MYDNLLYNKRVRPTKTEPQQGISYLERAREREKEREGWVGFKVRLGLRDRGERQRQRQRNKETKIRRNRADKKNPEQSRVAHLVINK